MKVLVIRLSSMGDIVLTSPVLRLLKRELNAETFFLTKPSYASLLEHNPYVDHVYSFSESTSRTIKELKKVKFDLIIDLHKNLISRRIRFSLKVRTIQYQKRTIDKLRILGLRQTHLQSAPVAQRYIDTLSELGIGDDGFGLDFFIPEGFNRKNTTSRGRKKVVIITGGTYLTKRIPVELISEIVSQKKWFFQLIGGSDVDSNLKSLRRENCYNGIGKLSWEESAAVIRDADIVITGDTGLMHVAAAMQKPIIVIWGSTAPNFGFSPFYGSNSQQRSIAISENLNCRPCSKYGRDRCPKGHMNCLNSLQSTQVIQAIEALLR